MPHAPELTKKQKRQHVKAAYEKGNVQEFPGAPVWNEWLKEKHEAKKREIGVARRVGRSVLGAAAVTVLVGKELPRALTVQRHKDNVAKVKRLEQVVNRTNSVEATSDTDSRRIGNGRLRRIGRGVMGAIDRSNERSLNRTNQKVERLSAKKKADQQGQMGSVESWANNRLNRIDNKRRVARQNRQKQFEAEKQVAWNKYLAENPDVKAQLSAEQKQRDEQFEINARRERYSQMRSSSSDTTEYFTRRNAYSFSKSLPRRPNFEGSYDDLAKSSIELAAKKRKDDGSISLFSSETFASVVKERLPLSADTVQRDGPVIFDGETRNTNQSFFTKAYMLEQEIHGRYDYTGGVATSLWKMGFVNFESEDSIPYGKGEFNSDIEWRQDKEGTTFASLAYNPENELHRIVAGDQVKMTNGRIQLAINQNQSYAPEMSVGLVQQPALAHAA